MFTLEIHPHRASAKIKTIQSTQGSALEGVARGGAEMNKNVENPWEDLEFKEKDIPARYTPEIIQKYTAQLWSGFRTYAGDLSGIEILDIGTGTGTFAFRFAEGIADDTSRQIPHRVIGLDRSVEMLADAERERQKKGVGNLRFLRADMLALPFANDSFDLVVSTVAMHHVRGKKPIFSEVRRVLKPTGRFILIDVMFQDEKERQLAKTAEGIRQVYRDVTLYSEAEKEIIVRIISNPNDPASMVYAVEREFPALVDEMRSMAQSVGFSKIRVSPIHPFFQLLVAERMHLHN